MLTLIVGVVGLCFFAREWDDDDTKTFWHTLGLASVVLAPIGAPVIIAVPYLCYWGVRATIYATKHAAAAIGEMKQKYDQGKGKVPPVIKYLPAPLPPPQPRKPTKEELEEQCQVEHRRRVEKINASDLPPEDKQAHINRSLDILNEQLQSLWG